MADELLRDLSLRCGCFHEQRLPCVSCRAAAEIERLLTKSNELRVELIDIYTRLINIRTRIDVGIATSANRDEDTHE